MLTRAGWGVVAASALALGAGRLFGVVELYVAATAGVAACVLALVAVATSSTEVTVARRMVPARMTVGQRGHIDLHVHQPGRRTWLPLHLVDPVAGTLGVHLTTAPLAHGQDRVVSYRVPTAARGLLSVGPLHAEVVDPFGLARRRVGSLPRTDVLVLPRAVDPGPATRIAGWREPSTGRADLLSPSTTPAEAATLRPYVIGDDLRRVHWPSSAHSGELQVRNDDQQWQGQVAVLVDNRRSSTDRAGFEHLVSIAAGLVHAVAANGDQIRLLFTDGADSGMVDARRATTALLTQLALVEQHDPGTTAWPAPPGRPDACLVVVASGRSGHQLAADVAPLGYGHLDLVGPADAPPEPAAHG